MPRYVGRSILGTALLILAVSESSLAWLSTERRTMSLTFGKPIALPGMALVPGTYVFELAAPRSDPRIVRVLSRDRSTVYFTGLTQLVSRLADPRRPVAVTFGKAPPGKAPPVMVWYPPGDSNGRRFVYTGPAP
jgi:hypothetical protein